MLSYFKNVEIIGNKFCYSGKNKFYVFFFKSLHDIYALNLKNMET